MVVLAERDGRQAELLYRGRREAVNHEGLQEVCVGYEAIGHLIGKRYGVQVPANRRAGRVEQARVQVHEHQQVRQFNQIGAGLRVYRGAVPEILGTITDLPLRRLGDEEQGHCGA